MNSVKFSRVNGTSGQGSLLMIYTGGTMGMKVGKDGSLSPLDFSEISLMLPELEYFPLVIDVCCLEPAMDSSNVTPLIWQTLAKLIYDTSDRYDGFVVLHGTDTMAYTASALSFMLQNFSKPVFLTGSQIPLGAIRNDARGNVLASIELVSSTFGNGNLIPEVAIFFDNLLLRGVRVTKAQTNNFTAFESENYPVLATCGIDIKYDFSAIKKVKKEDFTYYPEMLQDVSLVKIFPGMSYDYLSYIFSEKGPKGIVLETFGSGNAPTSDVFLKLMEKGIKNDKLICNVSQCRGGRVVMGKYETSSKLKSIGISSGEDMTTEAALVKMMHLLSYYTIDQSRQLIEQDIVGEMTKKYI